MLLYGLASSSTTIDTNITGIVMREMLQNLLHPLMTSNAKVIRFNVHHSFATSANAIVGRSAHIAFLDSDIFIEKFMNVCALKYFA